MKHLRTFATTIVLAVLLIAIGCDRTDFDKILKNQENQNEEITKNEEKLKNHEARLKALEELTATINQEIKTIKGLVDALQKKVSIVSYSELKDKTGYELVMSDGTKITLKNGKDAVAPSLRINADNHWEISTDGGKSWQLMLGSDEKPVVAKGKDGKDAVAPSLRINAENHWEISADGGKSWQLMLDSDGKPVVAKGKDGQDGQDGKDGSTPLVNVKKHTDGNLYWTIDDEWMLDADGNKVLAVGKDGQDGQDGQDGKDAVAPSLRINAENHWEISTDGGKSWQLMLGSDGKPVVAKGKDGADGKDGDAKLQITETETTITITYNGSTYTIPKGSAVAVTGVSLDKTTLSIAAGSTAQLTATVAPADATNKNVTWKSNNAATAKVDAKGKVTAVAKGTAKITVTTKDGNKTADCTVTVTGASTPVAEKMTFTTTKAVGEKVKLGINAASADQKDCWIDLNNNGTKDDGEANIVFDDYKEYTLGSQTVTLYGKLTELACEYNSLSKLDVSKNTALTYLSCYSNELSKLDVSENKALTYLHCYNNGLSSLDVSQNKALTVLYCSSNDLGKLDVSQNKALTRLNCEDNELSKLDVSQNKKLTQLSCDNTGLSSLDVSQNTALTLLDCGNNGLSSLDVSQNKALTYLHCYNNGLSSLDVSQNTALTGLSCSENSLSSLDVSQNTALTYLNCSSNQLTSLNVANGNNKKFKYPYGSTKPAFDATNNPSLSCIKVDKDFVPPTTGDKEWKKDATATYRNDGTDCGASVAVTGVSLNKTTLSIAAGSTAQLTATVAPADATNKAVTWKSSNAATAKVDAKGKVTAVKAGTAKITVTTKDGNKTADCTVTVTGASTPGTEKMTFTTTKAVGEKVNLRINAASADQKDCWIDLNNNGTKDDGEANIVFDDYKEYTLGSQTVTLYGKLTLLGCSSNNLSKLDVSQNTALTYLSCYSNELSKLDVSQNTALTYLSCYSNELSKLDVSQNKALTKLDCYNNDLSSLDVSQNKALTKLDCYNNDLSSLDVSQNKALIVLYCDANDLSSLDVSQNKALTWLRCYSNELSKLDVSQNTALTLLWCASNQLTSLNVANGNNKKFKYPYGSTKPAFDATNNPSLSCIKVDKDFVPPTTGDKEWKKDDDATYRNDGTSCP